MPPRTSYELAPAGVDLQRVIDAIDAWELPADLAVIRNQPDLLVVCRPIPLRGGLCIGGNGAGGLRRCRSP